MTEMKGNGDEQGGGERLFLHHAPPPPPTLHPDWMVTMLLFFLHDFTITESWNWQTKMEFTGKLSLKTEERFIKEEHFHCKKSNKDGERK